MYAERRMVILKSAVRQRTALFYSYFCYSKQNLNTHHEQNIAYPIFVVYYSPFITCPKDTAAPHRAHSMR